VAAALALAVVVAEVGVGAALGYPRLGALAALVSAMLAVAAVFRFPFATAVVVLFMTASIFHSSRYTVSVGSVQLHPDEVLFAALAAVAVVAPRRRTWGGAAGAALAGFLAVVALCAWLGVQSGRVTVTDAFNWARPLLFYASFWVVLRLFPDARSLRRLLIAGLACGALTGVLALVLQFTSSLSDMFQARGGQQIYTQASQADLGGLKRIREPGLAFSYILFFWSLVAAMTARGRMRPVLWTLVIASALNVILSFNRNMWVGLLFGLALMLALSGLRLRQRLLGGLAVGLTAIVLTFTVVLNSGSAAEFEPIVERAATVFTPRQIGEESSLRDRANETSQAWQTIQAHPVFGVGAGADYGVRFNHHEGNGVFVNTVQRFLHNQWLWLMLIGGVPAVLAYLAFIGTVLFKAWSGPARTLSQAALGVGIAMVMLSAFVMPYLGIPEFCIAIGVVAAVIVRARELELARRRPALPGATDEGPGLRLLAGRGRAADGWNALRARDPRRPFAGS